MMIEVSSGTLVSDRLPWHRIRRKTYISKDGQFIQTIKGFWADILVRHKDGEVVGQYETMSEFERLFPRDREQFYARRRNASHHRRSRKRRKLSK